MNRFAHPGGWACDVGAGNGRHSLLLAARGYRVVAIEADRASATRLRAAARSAALPIRVHHGDVLETELTAAFGFVCVTNLLHHLSRPSGRRLLARLRTATVPRGVHVVTVFTTGKPVQPVRSPFARGELRAIYLDAGWDILAYREWTTRPLKFGGTVARSFPYAAVIARRPGG